MVITLNLLKPAYYYAIVIMSRLLTVQATAAATRITVVVIAILSKLFVEDYDSSAETILLGSSKALIPQTILYKIFSEFVRWDAFYFLHIAENGYIYEQETAFFPMLPMFARLAAETGNIKSRCTLLLCW